MKLVGSLDGCQSYSSTTLDWNETHVSEAACPSAGV
jgi:hypothetical protein